MADPKQEVNNGPSQSRVVLAKPRLGAFGGSSSIATESSKSRNPFGSVLRPPQLKPTLGGNPFLKALSESDSKENSDEKPTDERLKDDPKDKEEAPKFVPLAWGNMTSRSSNAVPPTSHAVSSASSSSFVFGQNLSERVVMNEKVNNCGSSTEHSSSNGTSELLFTSAAATVKDNQEEGSEAAGEGLAAAAAEYERSHARPPPPTSNCPMTGEEEEINVLQISCRLFAWEGGSWRERGRGVLRLNDAAASGAGAGGGSRLVARVAGSLRVVLNTKLWPAMVLERADAKSLRITAMDAQHQLKLFLIMGISADISQLHNALSCRVMASKRSLNSTKEAEGRLDPPNTDEVAGQFAENYHEGTEDCEFSDPPDVKCNEPTDSNSLKSERLESGTDKGSDGPVDPQVDGSSNEAEENKSLKRKNPQVESEHSPKRQCPTILIE